MGFEIKQNSEEKMKKSMLDIDECIELYLDGETPQRLGEKYGVSRMTIVNKLKELKLYQSWRGHQKSTCPICGNTTWARSLKAKKWMERLCNLKKNS